MLTKILTAAIGLILALMVLRFIADRAHRAQIKARAAREAERNPASAPERNRVTPLEIDPDTGVYRPKT